MTMRTVMRAGFLALAVLAPARAVQAAEATAGPGRISDVGHVPGIVQRPGEPPGPTTEAGRAGPLARPNGTPARASSLSLPMIEIGRASCRERV